jgi:thiosulfate dehydrogenase [quinone] large subunit
MINRRKFSSAQKKSRNTNQSTNNNREVAYALLRATLGVIFVTTAVVKFIMGVGAFAAALEQSFAGKLPMFLVSPFGYALPFAEVSVGALLILGLLNRFALILAGLLLMALTFGKTAASDSATVAGNLSYALVIFVLLWLSDHNGYSIDRLTRRKPLGLNSARD